MATSESTGRVTKVLREKGYGFIREDVVGTEYFFHRTAVDNPAFDQLSEGQAVRFKAVSAPKGPRAEDVAVIPKDR